MLVDPLNLSQATCLMILPRSSAKTNTRLRKLFRTRRKRHGYKLGRTAWSPPSPRMAYYPSRRTQSRKVWSRSPRHTLHHSKLPQPHPASTDSSRSRPHLRFAPTLGNDGHSSSRTEAGLTVKMWIQGEAWQGKVEVATTIRDLFTHPDSPPRSPGLHSILGTRRGMNVVEQEFAAKLSSSILRPPDSICPSAPIIVGIISVTRTVSNISENQSLHLLVAAFGSLPNVLLSFVYVGLKVSTLGVLDQALGLPNASVAVLQKPDTLCRCRSAGSKSRTVDSLRTLIAV